MDRILALEKHVAEAVRELGPAVLGRRIRRARQREGISIRTLARRAQVSATSIVRLEQGLTFLPVTFAKVCEGLGLHVDRFLQPDDEDGVVKVHRRNDDEWFRLEHIEAGPIKSASDQALRKRAALDEHIAPLLLFKTHLESGAAYASLIELFEPGETRAHPGEEFLYVLSGTLSITIAGKPHVLEEGECLSFWATEPHVYAPAEGSTLPVRLLCVLVTTQADPHA